MIKKFILILGVSISTLTFELSPMAHGSSTMLDEVMAQRDYSQALENSNSIFKKLFGKQKFDDLLGGNQKFQDVFLRANQNDELSSEILGLNWLFQLGNKDYLMRENSVKSLLTVLARPHYGKTEIRAIKFLFDFLGSDPVNTLRDKIIAGPEFFETQVGEKILSMINDFYDKNGSLSNLRVHRSEKFTVFNGQVRNILNELLDPNSIDERDLLTIIEDLHLLLMETSDAMGNPQIHDELKAQIALREVLVKKLVVLEMKRGQLIKDRRTEIDRLNAEESLNRQKVELLEQQENERDRQKKIGEAFLERQKMSRFNRLVENIRRPLNNIK